MVWNTHQYWSIFTQEHFLSWSLLAELPWLVKVALISWNEWLHTGLYREFHSNNTKAVKYDLVAPVQFLFDYSPNPISDENNRQKLQTKITDENLRQKSQTKISDENLRRKSQTTQTKISNNIKCKIRDKDNFATKQCMLGVKKIKQLKRVIRDKADFATKQRMLGVKIFVQN